MVRPSLARIGAPGDGYATDRDSYWGSGFFVAPGWLLTCAHVVGKGGAAVCRGESPLSVTWQERTAVGAWEPCSGTGTAVVVVPRPDGAGQARDPWPFPDLALVRVTGADDVRCLWLGDREAGPRSPLGLYGWSVQTGELGIREATGELAGSDARALLLAGSLPIGGLSGGPVLDLRHGSVIGVIKGRRREEGVAVPVTALYELLDSREAGRVVREVLRAHELHHAGLLGRPSPYPDWTAFQAALPGHAPEVSGITAELRTRLYGHLAQLPPPAGAGEVVHLVEDVKEQVRGERLRSLVLRNVRTWREGAALLYGLRTLDAGGGGTLVDLDAVLLYAARVARRAGRERPGGVDEGRLRAFGEWIAGQAADHRHWAVGDAIRALLDGAGGGPGGVPSQGAAVEVPAPAEYAGTPRPAGFAGAPLPAGGGPATAVPAPGAVPAGNGPGRAPEWDRGAPPVVTPSSGTPTDVLVKVGPATYGRHPWSVQLIYDGQDVTPVDGDDRGARPEELARVLREPVARALSQGDHGEHLAAIEVFLPRKLFDLPVDEWQLLSAPGADAFGPPSGTPDHGDEDTHRGENGYGAEDAYSGEDDEDDDFVDERALPLGIRRTVVVRDVRRNGLPPSPEWRRRWKGVQRGPLEPGTLHGRPPGECRPAGPRTGGKYPYYGALSAMGDATVPLYCGPVGSGEGYAAMRDALRAGHPLVLWRRDGHDPAECLDFHHQAAALLGLAAHADGLHGPVRDLRIRLADPDTARAHGLRGKIAVLFDPPDRPPYGTETMRPPPLAAPGG
ncbi:trypsin-like peptidase domain-containing protein [Streptomyces actinomycinicus]|uniref:Trypsin-like peptidase domain-containing protein n=2 Tax=Streptomyces actinomycinicus TaxID=1695166 RepID=A0A937ELH9_9ACTN|nr:trypsin-like peptidase domain-containing protein [Streptomyces actinomycinicus]